MPSILTHTKPKERPQVVKIKTSCFKTKNGLAKRRDIHFLKKRTNFNILGEDTSYIGADEVVKNIINLDSVADGYYYVVVCNESRDWETGIVEEYQYRLIPYD